MNSTSTDPGKHRLAVGLLQLGAAVCDAPLHDDLGQFRERERKFGKIAGGLDDVFHVDPEELPILELVQGLLARLVRFGARDEPVEFFPEGGSRLDEGRIAIFREEGEEVAMLAAQKVFPQVVAGAEEPREQRKGFLVADDVERLLFPLLARVGDDEVQELVE